MDENAKEFFLKEYESMQQRIATDVLHQRQATISAVLASAAVWSWMAANGNTDFSAIAEYIPFALSALALIGIAGLDARIRRTGAYMHKVESAFKLDQGLGWEHSREDTWHGQGGNWGATFWVAFWLCLLVANLVGAWFHK